MADTRQVFSHRVGRDGKVIRTLAGQAILCMNGSIAVMLEVLPLDGRLEIAPAEGEAPKDQTHDLLKATAVTLEIVARVNHDKHGGTFEKCLDTHCSDVRETLAEIAGVIA